MTRTDDVADNTVAERPLVEGERGIASFGVQPYQPTRMWHTWDYDELAPVIRVNAGGGDLPVHLSADLESAETGFECGAFVSLGEEDALAVARAVAKTAAACGGGGAEYFSRRASSAQAIADFRAGLEDRISEVITEGGGVRVSVTVEPLETPEMGETVTTPDGEGVVVRPTTEPGAIMVDVEGGGPEKYDLGELS